jgi:hypothetical protein
MIKITFDCEYAELASYLSLMYEIYTKEDMDMSLGLLESQFVPALMWLFHNLGNHVKPENEIIDSYGMVKSKFADYDWEILSRFLEAFLSIRRDFIS